MASLNFDNLWTGAFQHGPLSVGRNHFVLRRNEVPTGLGFPRWFAHHSAECLHAPWNLRIGHESGQTRIYIGGERGRELGPVQREEPVLRRSESRVRRPPPGDPVQALARLPPS